MYKLSHLVLHENLQLQMSLMLGPSQSKKKTDGSIPEISVFLNGTGIENQGCCGAVSCCNHG
jgi:hypothetical protein